MSASVRLRKGLCRKSIEVHKPRFLQKDGRDVALCFAVRTLASASLCGHSAIPANKVCCPQSFFQDKLNWAPRRELMIAVLTVEFRSRAYHETKKPRRPCLCDSSRDRFSFRLTNLNMPTFRQYCRNIGTLTQEMVYGLRAGIRWKSPQVPAA